MMRARIAAVLALCAAASACADVALPAPARPAPVARVAEPGGVRLSFERPVADRARIICGAGQPLPHPVYVVDGRRVSQDELSRMALRPEDLVAVEVIKRTDEAHPSGEGAMVILTTRAVARR